MAKTDSVHVSRYNVVYEMKESAKKALEKYGLSRIKISNHLVEDLSRGSAKLRADQAKAAYNPENGIGSPGEGLVKAIQVARMFVQTALDIGQREQEREDSIIQADRMYRFASAITGYLGLEETGRQIFEESQTTRTALKRELKKHKATVQGTIREHRQITYRRHGRNRR